MFCVLSPVSRDCVEQDSRRRTLSPMTISDDADPLTCSYVRPPPLLHTLTLCSGAVDLSLQLQKNPSPVQLLLSALPSHADTAAAAHQRGPRLMLTINMHFILHHFLPSIPPLRLLSAVIAFRAN